MGGGNSKNASVQSKMKAHSSLKALSSSSKPSYSAGNAYSFGNFNFSLLPTSKDIAIMHISPGSNDLTIDWMMLNEETCEVSWSNKRQSIQMPIMNRESNGGGTVDDINFLPNASKTIVKHCSKTRSITLIVDVMTVEGQALIAFLWNQNPWLKSSNSTIILILPTYSSERAGKGTTHPSLYGPAHAPLHAAVALGTWFGESFLSTKKKKVPEAGGTRVAFVPRHVWYASTNPVNHIVSELLTRLHLRLRIREELVNKSAIESKQSEDSYENVENEFKRLQQLYETTKEKREALIERALQRKKEDAVKRAARIKEKNDKANAIIKQQQEELKAREDWINDSNTKDDQKLQEPKIDVPVMLPVEESGEWTQHVDPASGHHYYVNTRTNETTWNKPDTFGDQKHQVKEINTETADDAARGVESGHLAANSDSGDKTSSTEAMLPVEESGEWAQHVDPRSGNHFYINVITGESTWTKPAEFGDQEHQVKELKPETADHASLVAKSVVSGNIETKESINRIHQELAIWKRKI